MTRIPSVMTESRSGFFFRPQALWQMVRLLGHLRNLVVHSNLVVVQVAHTWKEAFVAQVDSVGSKELVNLGPLMSRSFFVRVDMMEKHPFLVTKLSPYYDR